MAGERNIEVNGESWTFFIGKGNVKLRDPQRNGRVVTYADLLGITQEDVERGKANRSLSITPADVRAYILRLQGETQESVQTG